MTQSDFINFYRMHLNLEESDQKEFELSVEQPLPSSFRITPTFFSEMIRERISKYPFVHQVSYLKDVFSFELKSKEPEYKEFIKFLVAQTEVGNIQRQEIVSFLPHLFMDLKDHHRVLETCASPGSKTKNLLEILKTGLLISNDKTSSRVNILISESMKKSTTNFIVTQMDAMNMPNFSFKFDRICCDVPCSGDGTFKKNPAILPKWKLMDAISLSTMQFRILTRAMDLLKDDGILVYSTCSLNPIENEWVINKAINNSGNFELLDSYDFITYENTQKDKIKVRKGITKFKSGSFEYENESMSKCFRILPHDQNTGGFFIAILHKKPTEVEAIVKEPATGNKLNSAFVEVNDEAMAKIKNTCDISESKSHFVSFNSNFKNIFAVSELCFDVLIKNPKIKMVYAGIKAFTESDLRKEVFRPKSAFLEKENIKCDITLPFSDFLKLVSAMVVPLGEMESKPEGLFSACIEGLPNKVSGFSGGNKIFLYIDDNHRKAYSELYLQQII